MEQGLIDIRKKARELSKKFGEFSPYNISCGTLIAILDKLESAQQNICDVDDCIYPAVKHLCEEHSDPKNT